MRTAHTTIAFAITGPDDWRPGGGRSYCGRQSRGLSNGSTLSRRSAGSYAKTDFPRGVWGRAPDEAGASERNSDAQSSLAETSMIVGGVRVPGGTASAAGNDSSGRNGGSGRSEFWRNRVISVPQGVVERRGRHPACVESCGRERSQHVHAEQEARHDVPAKPGGHLYAMRGLLCSAQADRLDAGERRVRLDDINQAAARGQSPPDELRDDRQPVVGGDGEGTGIVNLFRPPTDDVSDVPMHGNSLPFERSDQPRREQELAASEQVVRIARRQSRLTGQCDAAAAAADRVVLRAETNVANA